MHKNYAAAGQELTHRSPSIATIQDYASPAHKLWAQLTHEAESAANGSPIKRKILRPILESYDMKEGLATILARGATDDIFTADGLKSLFHDLLKQAPSTLDLSIKDLQATLQNDPAATNPLIPFMYQKGYHAIQTHRLIHLLWQNGEDHIAFYLQNRSSLLYGVDIHPAAQLGSGIMLDHATGLVIGETAVVEDNVSLYQSVTLGGTGNQRGDRHPKVRQGAIIGAGAKVLGNIEIGEGSKIAAGSVVLKDVPAHVTVAGVPAKIVKEKLDKTHRSLTFTSTGLSSYAGQMIG
ncbi:MAG: serine O-acetyltransferase [Proteobacteria bacterium]|jgi:serine O-acetyltransferase|nr:serine O-acetyltransferase [Alphaproteobacteria bacterium]NCC02681.1 serine O-acetyltransferase [Pseudomonadota bacterium]